jgi:hypothetical protein
VSVACIMQHKGGLVRGGEVNVTLRMRSKVTKALGGSAPRHC